MTFGQFLSVLRARLWVVVAVALTIVVIATGVSFGLTKQYTATASVVVDSKPDPISVYGGAAGPGFIATQIDIIGSERVAQRVVRDLKLNENPQIMQQWADDTGRKGSIEQWLGALFSRQLDVTPSRESSVIFVNYKSPDPQFSAALANAFVRAYIQTTLELRTDPARRYSTFFDTRSKEARDALEKAQTKYTEFQKANGIIASDERLDIENARLNELSSQAVMLQAVTVESGSREKQAQGAQSDRLVEILNNPIVLGLKADVNRTEVRLQELNIRYGENHPQVLEAKANLAELRQRLDVETRRVASSVGVSNTINRQREAQVRAELELQREKVLRLKSVRDVGLVLARDVESAQRSYDAVLARLNQTSLESLSTQGNANMLTEALPPLEYSSPRILINIAASVVLGLFFGALTALVLEIRDRRVRSTVDLIDMVKLPILGVLPKPSGKRTQTNFLMQRVIAGSLPAPAKQ